MKLYKYLMHTNITPHQHQHQREHRSIGESNYPKLLLYSTTTHKYWGREANPTSYCCIREAVIYVLAEFVR